MLLALMLLCYAAACHAATAYYAMILMRRRHYDIYLLIRFFATPRHTSF